MSSDKNDHADDKSGDVTHVFTALPGDDEALQVTFLDVEKAFSNMISDFRRFMADNRGAMMEGVAKKVQS